MVKFQGGDRQTENEADLAEIVKIRKPSLVKRARLIRRSTTSRFCEELKRLKREDGSLIRQVLIVSLQPRSPSALDDTRAPKVPSTHWPFIAFAHPPVESKTKYQAEIFYPDFRSSPTQPKENEHYYQLILTDQKGDRSFAFCYKFLPKSVRSSSDHELENLRTSKGQSSVLVLISNLSNESLFFQLAADFVSDFDKEPARAAVLSETLLKLRISDSEIGQQPRRRVRSLIGRPEPRYVSGNVGHVSSLMQKIGVDDIALVLLCLLSEKRIVITGSCVSDVSQAVQTFVRLLLPLNWPYTLIPVIPDSLCELAYCPMPFIAGMLRCNLNMIADLIVPLPGNTENELVIVDLERGVILPCLPVQSSGDSLRSKALMNWAESMGFPKSVVNDLLVSLRSALPIKSLTKADEKIAKRIAEWYARIFGHFQKFQNSLLSVRNRKRLATSHPHRDTRELLHWFLETGILQNFILDQTESQNGLLSDSMKRFHSACKKFAPPIDERTGKRRKAQSLVWRLFNH